jgi:hypothetical protein
MVNWRDIGTALIFIAVGWLIAVLAVHLEVF